MFFRTTDDRNLTNQCNADCYCPSGYNPVCASIGISYSTACHAGCSEAATAYVGSKNETVSIYIYINIAAFSHCILRFCLCAFLSFIAFLIPIAWNRFRSNILLNTIFSIIFVLFSPSLSTISLFLGLYRLHMLRKPF